MNFKFENEKIGIRPTTIGEIDAIYTLEREPANYRFISAYEKPRHLQVINDGDEEHLTIWDKHSKTLIGFIILAGLKNYHLSLELRRIVISRPNQGFGRSALGLIKHYCFNALGFHRLWLDVFTDNKSAIALYASQGFRHEGTLREVIRTEQGYRSMHIYAVIKQEFF